MKFYDPFILPFVIGLYFIFAYLGIKFAVMLIRIGKPERKKIAKGIISVKTLSAVKEVFLEALLHKRIFKVNPMLGYMHMSLAFGWFLLILFGKIGTLSYSRDFFNPIHYAIFFKYFEPRDPAFFYSKTYFLLMDSFLLFILSGLTLAIVKRFRTRIFGMKKTTRLRFFDKMALTSLWLIFPFRLIAESFTSGAFQSGHFLSGTLGSVFAGFLPVENLMYPAWWAYSLALGFFFVSLPFSRYMHIPTEMLLIFLRKWGLDTGTKMSGYAEAQVLSCSRCGICIDNCQLKTAGETQANPVYFIQALRNQQVNPALAMNCLQCGRCEEICPVKIDIRQLRLITRQHLTPDQSDYHYLPVEQPVKADVIFFGGCMTHLTPGIVAAMKKLVAESGEKVWFMDEQESVCCGRPQLLAGEAESAMRLIEHNRQLITGSGAKLLVTSCPICLTVFVREYNLGIEVLHHSQYLLRLTRSQKIRPKPALLKIAYHDPCELGRGNAIYEEPRQLINSSAILVKTKHEKQMSLCCGGSLGNLQLNADQQNLILDETLQSLTAANPDIIATSCPLCKKTFQKSSPVPVLDIAEIAAGTWQHYIQPASQNQEKANIHELAENQLMN